MKTEGISPKAIAAVITAVLTYLLGQQVLELPALAMVLGQAALVGVAAYAAGVGRVVGSANGPGNDELLDIPD